MKKFLIAIGILIALALGILAGAGLVQEDFAKTGCSNLSAGVLLFQGIKMLFTTAFLGALAFGLLFLIAATTQDIREAHQANKLYKESHTLPPFSERLQDTLAGLKDWIKDIWLVALIWIVGGIAAIAALAGISYGVGKLLWHIFC
jgi:Na+/H+ antiporter NhaC